MHAGQMLRGEFKEQAAHFTAMEDEYNQYIGALQEEYYHHVIALQEDQAPNHNVQCVVDVLSGQNVSYWELRIYTVSDIIIYDVSADICDNFPKPVN